MEEEDIIDMENVISSLFIEYMYIYTEIFKCIYYLPFVVRDTFFEVFQTKGFCT